MNASSARRRLRSLGLALLGLCFHAGPLAAHAATEAPRLVVVPFANTGGVSDRTARGLSAEVVDALALREDKLQLVPPPPLQAQGPLAAMKKASVDPTSLINDGRRALEELRFEDAASAFKKGVDVSLHDPATAQFGPVFEGLLGMAAAYFRLDDEKSAQAALGTLLRLDPSFKLPADKYPPVFTRELEKARKRSEKVARGSVGIDGPPGATAFLNGRDLGMVPVTEPDQLVGMHYVKVEGTRGEKFAQAVELKAGTVRVKAVFASQGAADPQVASALDADAVTRLAAYTEAAGADFALVAVVAPGGGGVTVAPALFSLSQRGVVALTSFGLPADLSGGDAEVAGLAEEIARRAGAFGTVAPLPLMLSGRASAPVASAPEPTRAAVASSAPTAAVALDESYPEVRSKKGWPVWAWVAVGVGVAAIAGGTYVGVSQATRPVTGTVTATW